MMRPEKLDFPPLHCSLEPRLGDYYQDFSPAIELVESGYHGGLDDEGVPLVRYGDHGTFHNAVITAQYALANMIALSRGDRARSDRVKVQLNWLVESQETSGELAGCWAMEHDNPKYPWLRAPWTSALASGNAISALLRGWELFGDERYRATADAAYRALHVPSTSMVLCQERGEELWYEEYPGEPPLHVLNGHVYALLGVLDHARVTGDPEAEARWRRAAATLISHLHEFDLGYWSAYDLRWREPVSLHYQKNIHVPLLRILGALTGDARFMAVADRWERQVGSITSRLRWYAALRLRRWSRQQPLRRTRGGPADDNARISRATSKRRDTEPAPTVGASISLRPFPYPFRAALSISNDADLLTPESFRRLHRFLSTDADSEWGPGLALQVGGSFFMFRSPDSPNEFTVFDRLTSTITDDGEFILECVRRGLVDVLHTYGCFTDPTHFTRQLAETALDALSSRGITIETWVNHGPPTNVQCIGTRDGWQGDAVGEPGYHADLTIAHGVRWVWTGTEMVDRVALDPLHPPRSGGSGLKRLDPRARGSVDGQTALVEPYSLRDGQRVRRFYRYTGLGGRTPVLDDLPGQLSSANLDELVRAAGYAIVYQHLAVRRLHRGFGTGAYGSVGDRWFAPAELSALRRLAQRHRDGEIWVAPTTRLLRYRDLHRRVRWHARREAEHDVIVISSGATGARTGHVSPQDLADLTFYCERPETTRVYVETAHGLEAVDQVRPNPADTTFRQSVTVLPGTKASPLP
jgi:hypothetical protein